MLKSLLEIFSGQTLERKPSIPGRIKTLTYEIHDEDVAKAMFDWYAQREAALATIQDFVKEKCTPLLMKRECPYYKLDTQGKLSSVAYTGLVPLGWDGIPGTHWMEPKSIEACNEVNALPKARTLKELHDLIDWPTLEEQWFHSKEYGVIERINHMIVPYGDKGRTFIDVPHPENFKEFPRIYEQILKWEPPSFLEDITNKTNTRNDLNREI